MTDEDLLCIELPDKYNYEIWQNSDELEKSMRLHHTTPVDVSRTFSEDAKENNNATSHAFSPFGIIKEARALKAMDIFGFQDYRELKGHFFNEFGKSFFKKTQTHTDRPRATRINLFKSKDKMKRSPPFETLIKPSLSKNNPIQQSMTEKILTGFDHSLQDSRVPIMSISEKSAFKLKVGKFFCH